MSKKIKAEEVMRHIESEAVHTSSDLELKTEMGKDSPIIVSNDIELYARMLKKFPQEKYRTARRAKKTGKILTALGVAVTVVTCGVFASVGLTMAGIGAAVGMTGAVLDDYPGYKLFIDYDNNRLIFVHKKKFK